MGVQGKRSPGEQEASILTVLVQKRPCFFLLRLDSGLLVLPLSLSTSNL